MFLNGQVKHGVEVIEEIHHFHRGALGGQAGKAHYVREVDCHRLVQLSLDQLAFLQLLSYNTSIGKRRKKICDQYSCAKVL